MSPVSSLSPLVLPSPPSSPKPSISGTLWRKKGVFGAWKPHVFTITGQYLIELSPKPGMPSPRVFNLRDCLVIVSQQQHLPGTFDLVVSSRKMYFFKAGSREVRDAWVQEMARFAAVKIAEFPASPVSAPASPTKTTSPTSAAAAGDKLSKAKGAKRPVSEELSAAAAAEVGDKLSKATTGDHRRSRSSFMARVFMASGTKTNSSASSSPQNSNPASPQSSAPPSPTDSLASPATPIASLPITPRSPGSAPASPAKHQRSWTTGGARGGSPGIKPSVSTPLLPALQALDGRSVGTSSAPSSPRAPPAQGLHSAMKIARKTAEAKVASSEEPPPQQQQDLLLSVLKRTQSFEDVSKGMPLNRHSRLHSSLIDMRFAEEHPSPDLEEKVKGTTAEEVTAQLPDLESFLCPVLIGNILGEVVAVNRAAVELLGYSEVEEMQRVSISELLNEPFSAQFVDKIAGQRRALKVEKKNREKLLTNILLAKLPVEGFFLVNFLGEL